MPYKLSSWKFLPCPRKPSTTYLPWIGKSYLGIDKGLVILMFENYSTQLIWKLLHQNKSIQKGLKTLEFTQVGNGVE